MNVTETEKFLNGLFPPPPFFWVVVVVVAVQRQLSIDQTALAVIVMAVVGEMIVR